MFALDSLKDISQFVDEFLLFGFLAKHRWHLFLEVGNDVRVNLESSTQCCELEVEHDSISSMTESKRSPHLFVSPFSNSLSNFAGTSFLTWKIKYTVPRKEKCAPEELICLA